MKQLAFVCVLSLIASAASAQLPDNIQSDRGEDVPAFKVRPGYRVTRALADKAIKEARFLEFSDDSKTLFVSQRENGAIIALRDPDDKGIYKTVTTFVKNRHSAHGMDWHNGWLYFSQASEGSVSRARDDDGDGVADKIEAVIAPKTLPTGGGHPFIGLLVTDDAIYCTSSDPTNMTPELDSPRKTIYVFDSDGKNKRVFCTGIRNTEKIRYRPGTTEIWGWDHGSDNLGKKYGEKTAKEQPITDLLPPEELNHYVEGGFYGHPYLSGPRIPRPEWTDRPDFLDLASKTIEPEWLGHAHWAVLGFTFTKSGDMYYAAHGSWNSVKQVGAVVQKVLFDSVTGKPYGHQTIVDCQAQGRRWARPVDCVEAPDGSILFSTDDPVAALYRITVKESE